jgi:uncharacterized protein YwgA
MTIKVSSYRSIHVINVNINFIPDKRKLIQKNLFMSCSASSAWIVVHAPELYGSTALKLLVEEVIGDLKRKGQ